MVDIIGMGCKLTWKILPHCFSEGRSWFQCDTIWGTDKKVPLVRDFFISVFGIVCEPVYLFAIQQLMNEVNSTAGECRVITAIRHGVLRFFKAPSAAGFVAFYFSDERLVRG